LVEKNIKQCHEFKFHYVSDSVDYWPQYAGLLIAKTSLGLIYALNAASFIFVLVSLIFIKNKGE